MSPTAPVVTRADAGPRAGRRGDGKTADGRPGARRWLETGIFALVAFVPQLWARPGVADSDIKTYLYTDPGRFLRQSASMWDPTVGLGTVTHEQIGYLWPLGPFFWLVHALGIPLWVGQRLWVGAILFAAGTGVLYLCRTLGLEGPGRIVAGAMYMLSPYFLQDVGRMSVLLLPYAALGWLVAFVIRAVRRGGWRYPALLALVWLTISGNNASGPLYVAVAPALWLVYALVVTREHTVRQAWSALWRAIVLVVGVSVWWIMGLAIESGYGLNILGYTETVSAVAKTALASEVLRGLGYWFFYGSDSQGPWAAPLTGFTQNLWVVGVSFAVPVVALASAAFVRWRARVYCVMLVVVGMVLAVGSHPYNTPSVLGSFLKSFMTQSTAGLALRSSDRATPMVLLGLAMLLGAGITAVQARVRTVGLVSAGLALVLVGLANPAVWNGSTVLDRYKIPTPVPGYVAKAAAALNSSHPDTRVLGIPGDNFGVYRYGDTVDPIWPGLLSRSFMTRQQLPLGSLPGYDLMYGLDVPLQNGTANPAALAPLARLMSVGDVLVQNDEAYEIYQRPSPQALAATLDLPQAGLGTPVNFGTPKPNIAPQPVMDPQVLSTSPSIPWPAPLQVVAVTNPRPLSRAEPTTGALVVDGDGVGLTAAAGLGLLTNDVPVLYGGTLVKNADVLARTVAGNPTLVVTDSNRKTSFLWNVPSLNAGPTLSADQPRPKVSLNIFPHSADDVQTTSSTAGVSDVESEPDDVTHTAVMAIDGLLGTEWETHYGVSPIGKFWQVSANAPVTTDNVTIIQADAGNYQHQQWITQATLSFDGGSPLTVDLGPASRASAGQRISFGSRTFTTLRITIDATNLGHPSEALLNDASPVGLAEVRLAGLRAQQVVNMPGAVLNAVGTSSQRQRLVFIMTRLQTTVPLPADPEAVLARAFTIPTKRTFSVVGSAQLSAHASDAVVNAVLGRAQSNGVTVRATASDTLSGDVAATPSSALDGNPATAWSTGLGDPSVRNAWIQVDMGRSTTVDTLHMRVVADGYHSVPTRLRVQACSTLAADGRCPAGSPQAQVALPPVPDGRTRGDTATVPVHFPALTGRHLTVSFVGVRIETRRAAPPLTDAIAVSELGIPGVTVGALPASLPGTCRADLLQVDGKAVSVAVTGTTADALAGKALTVSLCGPGATSVTLGAGNHTLTTTSGSLTGFDVDQLALDSAPGGGAEPTVPGARALVAPSAHPAPHVRVTASSTTAEHVQVTGAHGPFWLVLGQSINNGWHATVDGSGKDLGKPVLIDGYANGWLVTPPASGTMTISLRWTPQTAEDITLVVSGAVVVVCLGLAVSPVRRRLRRFARHGAEPDRSPAAEEDAARVSDAGDRRPVLVSLVAPGRRTTPVAAIITAVACALVASIIVPPDAFVLVLVGIGAATLAACVMPRLAGVLRAGAVASALAAAAYVVVHQAMGHFLANGNWPGQFEVANVLVWVAVVLLGAEAAAGAVRDRLG